MYLKCEIVRWAADDPQPGIVEARITDIKGRRWSFLDKVAIFDMTGTIGPESNYPQPGLIRCEMLYDTSGEAAPEAAPTEMIVTTLHPDAVEAEDGHFTFSVGLDQLCWDDKGSGTAEPGSVVPEDFVGARLLKVIAAWHVFDSVRSPTSVNLWRLVRCGWVVESVPTGSIPDRRRTGWNRLTARVCRPVSAHWKTAGVRSCGRHSIRT